MENQRLIDAYNLQIINAVKMGINKDVAADFAGDSVILLMTRKCYDLKNHFRRSLHFSGLDVLKMWKNERVLRNSVDIDSVFEALEDNKTSRFIEDEHVLRPQILEAFKTLTELQKTVIYQYYFLNAKRGDMLEMGIKDPKAARHVALKKLRKKLKHLESY